MTENTTNNPPDDLTKLRRTPHALASWQNAQQSLRVRRYAPALASYRDLVQRFPGVPQLWTELSAAAAGDLDFDLAHQAVRRAMELAPADASVLIAIGLQFYRLRDLDQVGACFQRAVAADPSSANARVTLASWLERSRRADEASECIEACLARHPKNDRARHFKAFLLHRKGRNDEAETILRDLIKNDPSLSLEAQSNANHLLGTVLDALGQYAGALNCLSKAKMLRRRIVNTASIEQAYDNLDSARREVLAAMTPEMLRRWREEGAASPCPHPLALLGGPPRSGTTLIEQILGAHPEILVFDESDAFAKEVQDNLQPPPALAMSLKSLDTFSSAGRAQSTGRYFKNLLHEMKENPGARLLLDKNPAPTGSLHIWLRLFPLSKVVIALRDPRDIIISCYFQNIPVSPASVNFLSLERSARYYAGCMDVWLRLRELGGFDWMETRYEDVVGNLEAEGRRLTNFLGLPWHEAQATYYETARRKFVHAPTYSDVTKPVYTGAVGRWKHYAEALAPLQAGLEPYLRAFGYS